MLDASTLVDFALVRPYPQALVWTAVEEGMVLAIPATALAVAWAVGACCAAGGSTKTGSSGLLAWDRLNTPQILEQPAVANSAPAVTAPTDRARPIRRAAARMRLWRWLH